MAKLLDYNATLTQRTDLEPSLAIFRVRPDEIIRKGTDGGPWFVPGQYVTIGMNRPESAATDDDPRPASVRRPMSIASAPEDEAELDFYIRKVKNPESDLPLTHVMWPIKVGDRLFCRALAVGKFTLPDTIGVHDDRLKVFVAAGTGLAPFVSIARSRLRQDPGARLDDLAILHGASFPTSLGYFDELDGMAAEHGLRYMPTVSRPKPGDAWTGWTGRVEAFFAPNRIAETEAALGLPAGGLVPKRAAVLICGLQGTIAQTLQDLIPRGYVPDNRRLRRVLQVDDDVRSTVFWEQYDNTPVLDVNDEALMAKLRRQLHSAL